jgi:hypothetical protein
MSQPGLLRRHLPLWVLLVVTALAFAQLWGVEFSWDDEALIKDNQVTHSLANIGEFFTRDLWSTTRLSHLKSGYYRPLMLLSLAVDRALFGLSSGWAHLHSLLWHLGAVAGLYAVLVRLVPATAALAGATLFAFHPTQIEVLALVAARNDAMAAALMLVALWLVLDTDERRPVRLAGGAVAALAALLSKESAVLAPFMLLALDLGRGLWWGGKLGAQSPSDPEHADRSPPRFAWQRYAALLAALLVYLPLRRLADLDAAITPTSASLELVGSKVAQIIGVYGKLLVWPWPLTPARHIHYLPPAHETLLGAAVAVGLLGLAVWKSERRALALAGIGWALLTWAPSVAATVDKGLLGERYLYFSMAGLGLTLAAALPRSLRPWHVAVAAVPALLLIQLRLPHWKDSRTVWEHAHEVSPTPFTAGGLAWYVHRDKDYETTDQLFRMALGGDPPYRDVCDMVVMSLLEAREVKRAVKTAEWALSRGCDPKGLIGHHYAIALAGTGQWPQAVQVAAAMGRPPTGPSLVVLIADIARKGDLQKVARIAAQYPKDPSLLTRTSKMLRLSGDTETAAKVEQLAATLRQGPPQ